MQKQALPKANCSVTLACHDKRLKVKGGGICRACTVILLIGVIVIAHLTMYAWLPSRPLQQASSLANTASSTGIQKTATASEEGLNFHAHSKCGDCQSQQWAPYVVDRCEPGVGAHFAPCVAIQAAQRGISVSKAEELLYPDAELLLPGFINEMQRFDWLKQEEIVNSPRLKWSNLSADLTMEYVILMGGNGQNWVFRNARYTDDPFPGKPLSHFTCLAVLMLCCTGDNEASIPTCVMLKTRVADLSYSVKSARVLAEC